MDLDVQILSRDVIKLSRMTMDNVIKFVEFKHIEAMRFKKIVDEITR